MPRDTASARLARLAKARRERPNYIEGLGIKRPEPDYTDERLRAYAANLVLKLDDRPDAAYIKRAFDGFGLDPLNPFHWRVLVGMFARAHFQVRKSGSRKGVPRKWDREPLYMLGMLSLGLKKMHPDWTQDQICKEITTDEWITTRFPKFKNMKIPTLRRLLLEAQEAYSARHRKKP